MVASGRSTGCPPSLLCCKQHGRTRSADFLPRKKRMKRHHKSSSDGTLPRPSKYPFDGLPVDASAHIDSFSDARSKLRTAITSADALRIAKTRSPVAGQICLLVFKLLARWKPSVREWEGRPSRSPAYWWVGQSALLRGPSNQPPAEVSPKADGSPQVDAVCMKDGYPALCLAFLQGWWIM